MSRAVPVTLAVFLCALSTSYAGPPTGDVKVIEQSWKLQVSSVDVNSSSPQFMTYFPISESLSFIVTWNYTDSSDYAAGGLEIQLWEDDVMLDSTVVSDKSMDIDGDTLTFNIVVKVHQNNVVLKLTGMSSQTWGTVVNVASLTAHNANVSNFNSFNVQDVLDGSGVTLGKNRVNWFGILETRAYDDNGRRVSLDETDYSLVD